MTELVKAKTIIKIGECVVYSNGLHIPPTCPMEDYEKAVAWLMAADSAVTWALGDAINKGEAIYGEKYAQALDCTSYQYQTLSQRSSVCKRFPMDKRRLNLSYTHHETVAFFPDAEREQWLDVCEQEDLSCRELRKRVAKRVEKETGGDGDDIIVECPNCKETIRIQKGAIEK